MIVKSISTSRRALVTELLTVILTRILKKVGTLANPNLASLLERIQIINDIKSYENINRKANSLKDYEIYNDNAYPYVYDALATQLTQKTAMQMPIISDLNVAKCVVNKEATIYTDEPTRTYEYITDLDKEAIESLYEDAGFDTMLAKANKYFKLRNQTFLQVVPKDKKLKLRVLQGHNIDVIPDENDQETAFAYIVSNFDKKYWLKAGQDGVNQRTAEADDYESTTERYQVWTKDIVFTMNGKGDFISEVLPNPIGMLPFIDVAKDKDFEFFVRIGQALTDFTVDFNVAWSDLMYTSRLQGYSIGVLSGDPKLKPDSMTVGANKLLFLPVNPNNPESKLSFDFKNPSPNIDAQLKAIESLVATFLTTRGLDTKAVRITNAGGSYSSALERLLAMIDQFRATKDDFDLFQTVEYKLHKIVCKYLALLTGTDMLDPEYNVSQSVVESEVSVQFKTPEMTETTSEKLDNAQKKINLGIADSVSVLMDLERLSEEAAIEKMLGIQQRKVESLASLLPPPEVESTQETPETPEEIM